MEKIAVLTSGGDAPGMNACIRAVVRAALRRGLQVVGVRRGYSGLLAGELIALDGRSVSNIIQRGGTILGSSRCEEFKTAEGRRKAIEVLQGAGIEGLIAIGGDGTFRGARALAAEGGIRVMGVPATIDNDIYGTDYTIGFDTAINTVLEAIDRIRDTAGSHGRLFLVEVMGRSCGSIALEVAIAGGAEEVLIPEYQPDIAALCRMICDSRARGKQSLIIIVAEGIEAGGAFQVAEQIQCSASGERRVCVLGHVQRGGSPTAKDRVLASKLGASAVEALCSGKTGIMVGEVKGGIVYTPLRKVEERRRELNRSLVSFVKLLAG